MSQFNELRYVYFDGLGLCEDLDRIPPVCACRDMEAHLKGKCCCAAQAETPQASNSSSEGCLHSLETLRRSVSLFQRDAERERPKLDPDDLTAYESAKEFFLIDDTVRFIGEAVERVQNDLEEFRATCAHSALQRLKTKSEDLRNYLERLNNPSLCQTGGVMSGSKVRVSSSSKIRASVVPSTQVTTSRHVTYTEGSQPSAEDLKALAQKHQVCYEVWPEWSLVEGQRVKIGYMLELYGANAHEDGQDACHLGPGCGSCRETYEDMKRIAEWIMPQEERISRYEIEPFNRVLHIAPKQRKLRSEVVLTVKILHRHEVNLPVDECEQVCLKEMQDKLAALKVLEGRLPSRSASQTEAATGR
jgi:hypothetical protein